MMGVGTEESSMSRVSRSAAMTLIFLAGCSAGMDDPLSPTGSASVVTSSAHDALYTVNVDEGTVSVVSATDGSVSEVTVGREPTRITRAGPRVFVTLRAERGIAVLEERDGGLLMVDRFETGAEPVGIIAREDGERLYVALSTQDEVHELDARTGATLRTFAVEGHPAWLALHPSGDALYVGTQLGGRLVYLDLQQADPTPEEFTFPEVTGAGDEQDQPFTRRLTGDLAFAPDGGRLGVPALWVDNVKPTDAPDDGTVQMGGGYGSVGMGLSRINPGVALIDTDAHGRPDLDSSRMVFVAGFNQPDASGDIDTVRSYLTSVTFAPDGATLYATMEASQAVVAVSTATVWADESLCRFCTAVSDTGGSLAPFQGGFVEAAMAFVGVAHGPKGVAFVSEDQPWVHSWLDRSVAPLGSAARDAVAEQLSRGNRSDVVLLAQPSVRVAEPSLSPEIEEGRRLFYSATASEMVTDGAGVSCSTCHLEGRNDGLTWQLDVGARQTPSLVGNVGLTLPVTWTSEVASVAAEAAITSQSRMGGTGIEDTQLAAIEAFVNSQREVDLPHKGATDDAALRGKALFERADVGCASCHGGARYTDNAAHDLYGLRGVNTPTLVGVAATAPYLHDGSAPTLRAVLDTGRAGLMGDTSMLTEAEMDDLEAYLRSL